MSVPSIIDVARNMFSDSTFVNLEQKSVLRGLFPTVAATGEKQFFNTTGGATSGIVDQRFQDIPLTNGEHGRRMATMTKIFSALHVDEKDVFNMTFDPSNDYVQAIGRELARQYDNVLFTALLGTAATGKDGSGSTAFDAGQVIAHGSVGLTVAKLNEAIKMLELDGIDVGIDQLVMVVGPKGKEDLFNDDKMINGFYNHMSLMDKDGLKFRGIKIVTSNLIPVVSGSEERALLFTPEVLKVAMGRDVNVQMDRLVDKIDTHQILGTLMLGAVRMEEARIVDIRYSV